MPATNITLFGAGAFRFIGLDEKLQSGDLVRDVSQNNPDGPGWDTTYKPDDWDGACWHPIEQEMPYWVGKTYEQFMKGGQYPAPYHEIIRFIKET